MPQNPTKLITQDALIIPRKGKLIAVTIAVIASGGILKLYNSNSLQSLSQVPMYQVDGSAASEHTNLNIPFDKGLVAKVTGGAQYNVMYD